MSISQNFPNTRPSLNLNFARSKTLDPRITFTRTSTGTYVDESGFIRDAAADEPRFDHDPATGECLGLIIEEQRENRCTESVNFDYSATSNTTETTVFNPDGTAAIRRVPLSTGNFHGTSSNAANIDITSQAVGGTTDVTTSIFIRNYNNSNLSLLMGFVAVDDDAGPLYRYYLTFPNTADQSIGVPASNNGWSNGSTKVEDYGNGWYRYTFSARYTKQTGFDRISFVGEQIFSSTGQQFWYGDDVSGIYTWGKQIELGLFSTSYIPTSGSTVTRTPDNASITGTNFSDWYNQSEGTLYANFKGGRDSNPAGDYGTVVAHSNTYVMLSLGNSESKLLGYFQYPGPPTTVTLTIPNSDYVEVGGDICVSYDLTSTTLVKGSLQSTESINPASSVNPVTFWKLGSSTEANNRYLNGTISQLTYYPVRLPNATLQTLTK